MVPDYHPTLALCAESRRFLFCIAVAEQFVFALLSFFTFALAVRPVAYIYLFEGDKALAESGVLLLFSSGMHAFSENVGLFFVLQGSQFNFNEAYLAYYRSGEGDYKDEVCVEWFRTLFRVETCSIGLLLR